MKKLLFVLPIICLIFACKKEVNLPEEEILKPLIGKSTTAFFVDTFRVYATDLAGNNKRLVFDEDEKSGNNYIASIDYSGNKKLIYTYKTNSTFGFSLRIVDTDGTNKKVLKTLPAPNMTSSSDFPFASSFGGKILYTTREYVGNKIITETRLMDENGANDAKVNWPNPSMTARDGSGYLSISYDYGSTSPSQTIYRVKIKNGVFDEANSFTVPKITGIIRGTALSSDGNYFVYMLAANSTTTQYDVMAIDLSKKDGAAKKITTYELPKTGDGAVTGPTGVRLSFANGTANLILSYGVSVSGGRYANKDDYYFFQLLDTEKGTVTAKWKISNEYGGGHIVD